MKALFSKKNIPVFVLIVFGILLFTMGILNHYYFRTFTFDYGNYNFAFWDYSHFRISPMPTYPGTGNFLQDHFSFTLMYFVPLYWILNWITGTYTLILIQYTLILISAWYTYKLISLKSDNIWMSVGVLIYYFILLGRYTSVSCDVNIAVMSACFIPIFIYYFETRKYLISLIILVLSILSRENIPIWFVFIFVVLIIQHRKDKKAVVFSVVGILISVVYFILLFKVFIPSIETADKGFNLFNYAALGANPGEAILYIIHHPIETFKLFFINHLNDPAYDGVKAEFYLVYLISGGFILFFRPQYLIWFLPIIAQKVLNDNYIRWGIATYYSVEVVTLLPLSVFLVLTSIKKKLLQNGLIVVICIATITMTIYKLEAKNCRIPWLMTPSKENFFNKSFYKPPFNVRKVNKLLSQIPSNAAVSSSDQFFSHLSQRQSVYFFPTVKDAEYIVFSLFNDYFMISHKENEIKRNQYLSDPKWEIVSNEFPVFLLKLNESSTVKESIMQKLLSHSDTLFCDYEKIDSTKRTMLFSNEQKADTIMYLTTEKSHSGIHSLKLTPDRSYNTSVKFNDIDSIRYLQVSAWCYCLENTANIIVSNGTDFYMSSNIDIKEPSGWNYLVINCWVPKGLDKKIFAVYLWSQGKQPAYFDDLRIIKTYMK